MRGWVTEGAQVVFKVIGEMVALPRGFIVELDVDDMMGFLVGRFDHADHVEGYGLRKIKPGSFGRQYVRTEISSLALHGRGPRLERGLRLRHAN